MNHAQIKDLKNIGLWMKSEQSIGMGVIKKTRGNRLFNSSGSITIINFDSAKNHVVVGGRIKQKKSWMTSGVVAIS